MNLKKIILTISIINLLFYLIPWPNFINYALLLLAPYLIIPISIPILSLIMAKKLARQEIIEQAIMPFHLPIKMKKPLIFSIVLLILLYLILFVLESVAGSRYGFNNYIFIIFWIGAIASAIYFNKNLLSNLNTVQQTNEIGLKIKKLSLYLMLLLNIILLGFCVFVFVMMIKEGFSIKM